jgi:hypothetical protein
MAAHRDVYDVEPLPASHTLRTSQRVVLAPHIGYGVDTACASASSPLIYAHPNADRCFFEVRRVRKLICSQLRMHRAILMSSKAGSPARSAMR